MEARMSPTDASTVVPTEPDPTLRPLAAAVAEARRRVAAGATIDLLPLRRALDAMPRGGAVGPDWLVLLDELAGLCRELALARDAAGERVQSLARQRRVEAAYAAAGRRP
jgi:hypothetical protein